MNELDRIDWNLVPALDALLRERNVSRAARRLGMSQSAASGALARLRRQFGDELLVRRGVEGYELTPLAQRLAPVVEEAVSATRGILGSTGSFDPSTSTREFVVAATEYSQTVLGGVLARRVLEAAPGARVHFRHPSTIAPGPPAEWLASVDGWLAPRDVLPDLPAAGLFSDRWVCVVSADNLDVGERIDVSDVVRHPWIVPTVPRDRELPWMQRLLAHGIELPIAVVTESFGAVPFLVGGSRFVGLVQERLAAPVADVAGVRIIECPWSMLPLSFTCWWHLNREHDPAHRWFRELVASCMDELGA